MLDLVKGETERIDSRFLEPACGSGNFLVRILQRKLAAVELKFGKSDFERRHFALLALMCTYGIELLADNIAECRANMLEILANYLNLKESEDVYRAASYVLSQNLVHGDALTMRTSGGQAITFAEWGLVGNAHRLPAADSFEYPVLTEAGQHDQDCRSRHRRKGQREVARARSSRRRSSSACDDPRREADGTCVGDGSAERGCARRGLESP